MSSLKTTNILHPSSASNNIVLDSSGNIAVQAGTAGAPAIQANGDSNTGIYFPAADNIGFTTGGTIRGRWTTDGLCFNADTAAANALDDYEEGSFTPTITGDGFTRTYNSTYTQGRYTKIGRVVTIEVAMYVSSQTGTANGSAPEFNLPFASSSFVTAQHWSLTPLRLSAVASSEIAKIPVLNAMSDTTALRGYYQLSGINNSTSGQVINTNTWGPNYQVGYTLTYVTN